MTRVVHLQVLARLGPAFAFLGRAHTNCKIFTKTRLYMLVLWITFAEINKLVC